jgi:A/G-specific adenine glycosylase
MQMHPDSLAHDVLTWQLVHGRHDLPWQGTRDPYRIWLSEIMLQQTQVAAVIGYYQRFLERFPDVRALALAQQDEVMALWSGLGYYTRARNLHACAKEVLARFNGQFPNNPQELASLPGIGRSTAAAVAAFAFDHASPILDGNVKRVFCRVFAIAGVPSLPSTEKVLWAVAERETPARQIVAYTQGVMDLGATVCTRSRPRCDICPLQARCQAYAHGLQAQLPTRKPKKILPERRLSWLVLRRGDAVLLSKRGPGAVWEGLWAFPEYAANETLPISAVALTPIAHQFSHYRIVATPFLVKEPDPADLFAREALRTGGEWNWLARDEWEKAALPAPIKKFLLEQLDVS